MKPVPFSTELDSLGIRKPFATTPRCHSSMAVVPISTKAARDAMHAGILKGGFSGCDNSKLIAVLCTRTKASLNRTKAQYRAKFDRDLCKDVKSKTGSDYGRMMGHALSDPDEYVADVIHAACHGMGCDEGALIELCLTRSPEQLAAGK